MCVCVCVCVCERERESQRCKSLFKNWISLLLLHTNSVKKDHIDKRLKRKIKILRVCGLYQLKHDSITLHFSDDNSKSDGVGGLIKESRPDSSPLASVRKQVILKDDPDCPNLFKLEKLKKKSDPGLLSYFKKAHCVQ